MTDANYESHVKSTVLQCNPHNTACLFFILKYLLSLTIDFSYSGLSSYREYRESVMNENGVSNEVDVKPSASAIEPSISTASPTTAGMLRRSKRTRQPPSPLRSPRPARRNKRAKAASPALPPPNAKDEGCDCVICQEAMNKDDMAKVDGCAHVFCFTCIEQWSERQNTCPLCNKRFTQIERIHPKKNRAAANKKKVRDRSQRADYQNAQIESLLQQLYAAGAPAMGGTALQHFILNRAFSHFHENDDDEEDDDDDDYDLEGADDYFSFFPPPFGGMASRAARYTITGASSSNAGFSFAIEGGGRPTSLNIRFSTRRMFDGPSDGVGRTAATAINIADSDEDDI